MTIVIPAIPGFAGDIKSDDAVGIRAIMNFQYKSINRVVIAFWREFLKLALTLVIIFNFIT